MSVRDVRMMVCDSCETRFDLPDQSASEREARDYAAAYGWSHDLDAGGERIDLCEPCTNTRADVLGADIEPSEEGGER